ncbi:hypothetical protein E6A55_31255 [Cupriavidus necator H16]|uniref:Fragment of ATP-dependent DNA ligase n=1 Tax=Cupriavidus necator (strain ATCC 17699 / DSM 428 / KCTC 22496 / NCIMB 10442 / H16 / Stanier 337) TaxID=381666 RepID=Q0JYJ9_CUPNH|nr:fragment of ATP-dependent DNA ligase [Cupriavidus necator]QCC04944.1 hypothetical protein E6A55_31255 [Cupriavidus necator H16]QQB79631.1 hypothetical protein I6H87_30805 [Cupriavidus necator]CAJ97175.1 fragment of ATP-dependent DNA ligase [Cupriavidus necator H16]
MRARARRKGWYKRADLVAHCVFDLLVGKGEDLCGQPIERRKSALRRLLADSPAGILYVDSIEDGAWLYGHVLTLGLEGVVGKRAGSLYRDGERSPDWMKIKRPGAVPFKRFRR